MAGGLPIREGMLVAGCRVGPPLGEGGMGVVFAGHDEQLDRPVAIKVLHPAADSAQARRRFRQEATAIARLDHPGIVRVYSFGEQDGAPYFIMERVTGRPLRTFIQRARMIWRSGHDRDELIASGYLDHQPGAPYFLTDPPMNPVADDSFMTHVIELAVALADALAAAHAAGIIHRDLKPANVLLTAAGRPKLVDFGLVKRADGEGLTGGESPGGQAGAQAGDSPGEPADRSAGSLSAGPAAVVEPETRAGRADEPGPDPQGDPVPGPRNGSWGGARGAGDRRVAPGARRAARRAATAVAGRGRRPAGRDGGSGHGAGSPGRSAASSASTQSRPVAAMDGGAKRRFRAVQRGRPAFLGTLAYASPEQLGSGAPVSVRTDLFSFGVMLYELATLIHPFIGGDGDGIESRTLAGRILGFNPPPADDRAAGNPRVPAALAAVIARCLAKDPAARFADGSELAAALQGVRAAAESWTSGVGRFFRRVFSSFSVLGGFEIRKPTGSRSDLAGGLAPAASESAAPDPTDPTSAVSDRFGSGAVSGRDGHGWQRESPASPGAQGATGASGTGSVAASGPISWAATRVAAVTPVVGSDREPSDAGPAGGAVAGLLAVARRQLFHEFNISSSLDTLDQSLALVPDHPRALYYLAIALNATGEHLALRERLQPVVRLAAGAAGDRDRRLATVTRAIFLDQDPKTAEREATAYRRLYPEDGDLLYGLTFAVAAQGRLAEVIALGAKISEVFPDDNLVPFILADAYEDAGDFARAAATLDAAVGRSPDLPTLRLKAAGLLLFTGNLERGARHLANLDPAQPDHHLALMLRARLHLFAGRRPEAVADLHALIATADGPGLRAFAGYLLYRLLREMGDAPGAATALAQANSDQAALPWRSIEAATAVVAEMPLDGLARALPASWGPTALAVARRIALGALDAESYTHGNFGRTTCFELRVDGTVTTSILFSQYSLDNRPQPIAWFRLPEPPRLPLLDHQGRIPQVELRPLPAPYVGQMATVRLPQPLAPGHAECILAGFAPARLPRLAASAPRSSPLGFAVAGAPTDELAPVGAPTNGAVPDRAASRAVANSVAAPDGGPPTFAAGPGGGSRDGWRFVTPRFPATAARRQAVVVFVPTGLVATGLLTEPDQTVVTAAGTVLVFERFRFAGETLDVAMSLHPGDPRS